MTILSVNVNKIATLRNSRGSNIPNLLKVTEDIQDFGAEGITIHPRPDERHIKYSDARMLKNIVKSEFNIEGNPKPKLMDLVLEIKPDQVTLVPDAPDVVTSNRGWVKSDLNIDLKSIVRSIKDLGSKVSLFIDPTISMVELALNCEVDRVELYTGPYAKNYKIDKELSVSEYIKSSKLAYENNLDVNAGHDLDLNNLEFLKKNIPFLYEVSIGHALVCDALLFGLENTLKSYLSKIS